MRIASEFRASRTVEAPVFEPDVKDVLDGIPPHDVEVERAVLGSILTDELAAKIALGMLSVDDFYIGRHQVVFAAMKGMETAKLDELTVGSELKRLGKIAELGGREILGMFVLAAAPAAVEAHCEVILCHSRAARSLKIGYALIQSVHEDSDAGASKALESLTEIQKTPIVQDPGVTINAQLETEIAGTRRAIFSDMCPSLCSTRAFINGSVTVFCGSAGASKSLFMTEFAWRLHEKNVSVAKMDLESGTAFHMRRAWAQIAENSNLTDDSFVRQFPDNVREIRAQSEGRLKSLVSTGVFQDANKARVTSDFLLRWIDSECDRGRRVLIIDPLAMIENTDKFQADTNKFVMGARSRADRYGVSLILVTHPKNAMQGIDQGNIAGPQSLVRLTDSIFWLEAHKDGEFCGQDEINPRLIKVLPVNRTIHILKSRLGPAPKKHIAYFMDSGSLRHIERGFSNE